MAISNPSPLRLIRVGMLTAGFLTLILGVGCDSGPATGTVSGLVTVDGTPPSIGSSISFIPEDGKSPSSGALLVEGKYSVKVPVGKMKVAIRALRPMANQKVVKRDGPGPAAGDFSEEAVNDEYFDEKKTTLRLDVASGTQEKNWELPGKEKGKKK